MLTGNQFTFDQPVTTTNSGPVSLTHSGLLTINGGAVMNLNGSFTENGGGNVSIGANITSTSNNISWNDPVLLTGNVTLDTSVGQGDITLSNTVNGPFCLTLNAGAGEIVISGLIGSVTPLNCLNASAAEISNNGSIQTSGAVQETGAINLGANITTNGSAITLTGDVVVTAIASILSTNSGSGDIAITGTINAGGANNSLSLLTATGNVTIGDTIGGVIPINNLTIAGNNITWNNLGFTAPGSRGAVNLNASAAINFNGTSYMGATQNYTAETNFNLEGGATTSIITNNFPVTFTNGTIQLAPATDLTINTNGANVTLTELLGINRNLTISANTLDYVQIGTPSQFLNNVTLTANAFSPIPPTLIYANNIVVNSSTTLVLTNDVIQSGTIIFNVPVQIGATTVTISNCTGGGADIIFNKTLDADNSGLPRNVIIDSCGHQVSFNVPVGSGNPLTSITVGPSSKRQRQ